MGRWNPRANEIFLQAIEVSSHADRDTFLNKACGLDQHLRDEVESLLQADELAPSIFERESRALAFDRQAVSIVGAEIGPYKVREQIGEGGMGVVYVADQTKPIRRRVALKVIRPGMATADVIARFEAERQALAMMDHPNIAWVLDGGLTDAEQPYFVMELVQGVPLTEYCDQQRLDTRERLQLFLKVCWAVRHAHQRGIIHRDLKPSNILVPEIDGTAVPKVIDFGIAKAVDQKLTERTIYTQFSHMVGTPLYMSPEQVGRGVIDIDTRSDVYSLGVLLYELLTGSTPFSRETIKQADEEEVRRIIREDQPRLPSAMVGTLGAESRSTIAEQRRSEPGKLSTALRGELDWLVMKTLEKDRDRRYESASALAEDIERYLADEPVLARPPSGAYRLRKFVRRHRVLATSLVAVSLALSLGAAMATVGLLQAIEQRDLAQQAEKDARVLADLLSDMYPRPWGMKTLGRNHTVYEAIEEISPTLEQRLRDHPAVEVEVRQIFADAYTTAGEFDKARDHLNKALSLALRVHGEKHETVAEIHAALADEVGWNYGVPLDYAQRLEHAEKAIQIYESLGVESPMLCSAWFAKGHCLLWTSPERQAEAEAAQRECVDVARRLGNVPVIAMWDLGLLLMEIGDDRLEDAEVELKNALQAYQIGKHPPMHKATALSGLASCLRRKGDLPGAIDCFKESWNLFQDDSELRSEPRGFGVGLRLVETYFARGNVQEAFDLLSQIEDRLTREPSPIESLVDCLLLRGWLCYQLENHESATDAFGEAMTLAEQHFGSTAAAYGRLCGYLAETLRARGRPSDAAARFQELLPLTQGYVDQSRVDALLYWLHARAVLGSVENDVTALITAMDIASETLDYMGRWPRTWREPAFHQVIAGLHLRLGDRDAAIQSLEAGLAKAKEPHSTYRSSPQEVPTARGDLERMLAEVHLDGEDVAKAREVLREAVQVRETALGDDHIQIALAQLRLGEFLIAQSEYAPAEQPLLDAYEKLKSHPDVVKHLRLRAATELADVYEMMDRPEEATKWQAIADEYPPSRNATN